MPAITQSTHFDCTVFTSHKFEINPISMRSQNIFMSRIAHRRPNRVWTSSRTHLHGSHVIRVYSFWYCIDSPRAQLFHATKKVVTPLAVGLAESRWHSKYAWSSFALSFTHLFLHFMSSHSGTFCILNHGIHLFTISSTIFFVTSASTNQFHDAPLSRFFHAKLWPIASAILYIFMMVKEIKLWA